MILKLSKIFLILWCEFSQTEECWQAGRRSRSSKGYWLERIWTSDQALPGLNNYKEEKYWQKHMWKRPKAFYSQGLEGVLWERLLSTFGQIKAVILKPKKWRFLDTFQLIMNEGKMHIVSPNFCSNQIWDICFLFVCFNPIAQEIPIWLEDLQTGKNKNEEQTNLLNLLQNKLLFLFENKKKNKIIYRWTDSIFYVSYLKAVWTLWTE